MTSNLAAPNVSVLITTYNRATLLPRAIRSVLNQDFNDFEIIIVDDCSNDNTPDVVHEFEDPRIRYVRNEINQGAKYGDRAHVKRCIYELMRGRYFIYLCDDDFWLPKDLLRRQVDAFEKFPSLSMVIGGQAHIHLAPRETLETGTFFRYVPVPEVSELTYHTHGLFPAGFIKRHEFLDLYAESPLARNQLDGATLFSRDAMIKSKSFSTDDGSRWQAGYEFKIGPAAVGDVFYIDEPCVVAAMEPNNASYRGTQRQHYLDCLNSVEIACRNVYPVVPVDEQAAFERIRKKFILQITMGYLFNRIYFKSGGFDSNPIDHTQMFEENVTIAQVVSVFRKNKVPISIGVIVTTMLAAFPSFLLRGAMELSRAFDRDSKVPLRRIVRKKLQRIPATLNDPHS